jgi:hypothetical protein
VEAISIYDLFSPSLSAPQVWMADPVADAQTWLPAKRPASTSEGGAAGDRLGLLVCFPAAIRALLDR